MPILDPLGTPLRERIIRQLIHDEGVVPVFVGGQRLHQAYQDHLGVWTVGFGTNLRDKNAEKELAEVTDKTILALMAGVQFLSDDEANALMQRRIDVAVTDAMKLVPNFDKLDDPRKFVLVCMSFQFGRANLLKFKKFLEAMRNGDYSSASKEMLDSEWGRGKTGVRARAMAISMKNGSFPKTSEPKSIPLPSETAPPIHEATPSHANPTPPERRERNDPTDTTHVDNMESAHERNVNRSEGGGGRRGSDGDGATIHGTSTFDLRPHRGRD